MNYNLIAAMSDRLGSDIIETGLYYVKYLLPAHCI